MLSDEQIDQELLGSLEAFSRESRSLSSWADVNPDIMHNGKLRRMFGRAIESAACTERDQRIAELERELVAAKSVPMKYRRMAFNAELQVENANLRKELEAVRKDAARSRWLRDSDHWPAAFDSHIAPEPVRGGYLDAAIDAAKERT